VKLSAAFTLILLTLFGSTTVFAQEKIKIGVLAYQPLAVMEKSWGKFASLLEESFPGYLFEVVFLKNEALDQAVASRTVDYVFTSSANYIYLKKRFGLSAPSAMVIKRYHGQPLSAFGGVIFTTDRNQGINTLEDIPGNTIATIGMAGVGGYKLQAYEMLKKDVALPRHDDLLATGQPQDNVVRAVLENRAQVGFVRTGVLERMASNGELALEQIKVINQQNLPGYPYLSSTPLYPEWPFAALPHVDSQLTRKLTGLLLSLPYGEAFDGKTGLYGFDIPADYQGMDHVLKALRAPPYEFVNAVELEEVWESYKYPIIVLVILGVGLFITLLVSVFYNKKLSLANNQIIDQGKRMEDIIEATQIGTWEWNLETGDIVLNERWAEIVGYTLEELAPVTIDTWSRLAHPDDLEKSEAELQKVFSRQKEFYESEVRMRHKSGKWIWVLDRGRVLKWNSDGKPLQMAGTHADITEQKFYEQSLENEVVKRTSELTVAKEKAEEANKEKSRFLANMSHELRTPMHSILSFASLGEKETLGEKKIKYFKNIKQSATRLMILINGLLDISKLEAGKMEVNLESNDLSELVHKQLEELRALSYDKNIELQFECTDQAVAIFDKNLITQVVVNLLSNAIKFSPQNSHIKVTCGVSEDARQECLDGCIYFSVTDEGVGIPSDEIDQIFDRFVESSNTKSKAGGTGLGLSISKEIIKLHKGVIWAASPPAGCDKGSRFQFQIPINASNELKNHLPEAQGQVSTGI
jgi:PAS domain S-box-containing protein